MVTTRSRFAKRHGTTLTGHTRETQETRETCRAGRAPPQSVPTRSVDHFQYTRLEAPSKDIRLITLLPGTHDEHILVRIKHARLPIYDDDSPNAAEKTRREIEATLPPGWVVFETKEGRFIFSNDELDVSSWSHPSLPDDELPRSAIPYTPETPEFEALSYTWGSPHSRRAVFIEDPSHTGRRTKLLVTKNLAVALRHLRYRDLPRTLWVDAICINQQDMAERNEQVQRMPHIYRLAHRVVVWLGPGSRQSTRAMSALRFLAEQVIATRQNHMVRMPGAAERRWYNSSHDMPYDDVTWRAIFQLFQRIWFTRVWVVQEANLANARAVVQCGEDAMTWVAFRCAVVCLSIKDNLPPGEFRGAVETVSGLAVHDRAASYSRLVLSIYDRNCSDQRDRVYGLLGLMSKGLRDRVPVDYSLPVGEVYKQTALAVMEHFGRLDALRGCHDVGLERAIAAPSWVPDHIFPPKSLESRRMQFSAGMSRCVTRYLEPNILEVWGVRADVVSTVQLGFSTSLGDAPETIRGWTLPDIKRPYSGGGCFLDAFAVMLCGMRVGERFPWQPKLPGLEEWKAYCEKAILESEEPLVEQGTVSGLFLSNVEIVLYEQRFFSTAQGYIGLGPLGMQPGDVVTVMLGYDAPLLIREAVDGTYHVVGESIVYGFHDATCLLGPLPEPWTVQMFPDLVGDPTLYRYFNSDTGELADEDPRLPPLQGWTRVHDAGMTPDDPEIFQKYENVSTGERINYHPGMALDALKLRGVPLRSFRLS